MTYRQFLAWQAWLDAEWNRPSRTDHYLMVVAAEIRRVLSKHPGSIRPMDFQLKFVPAAPVVPSASRPQARRPQTRQPQPDTAEDDGPPVFSSRADASKALWLGRLGLGPDGTPQDQGPYTTDPPDHNDEVE